MTKLGYYEKPKGGPASLESTKAGIKRAIMEMQRFAGISPSGTHLRGGSREVAKFLSESNTFYIKSKTIKMLSCKNFATLLDSLIIYPRSDI